MSWSPIIGYALVLWAAWAVYRGRIPSSDPEKKQGWLYRSEKPVEFWIVVIVVLVSAVILILNVFHF
jgi:hypothetical protein